MISIILNTVFAMLVIGYCIVEDVKASQVFCPTVSNSQGVVCSTIDDNTTLNELSRHETHNSQTACVSDINGNQTCQTLGN